MLRSELLRTTAFRWAVVFAAAFTGLSLLLFAFVYWQTASQERTQLDGMLAHEAHLIAADPGAAAPVLSAWLREDQHNVRYGFLGDRDGTRLAGNMPAFPSGLALDGRAHEVSTLARDVDGDGRAELIRAVALPLPEGRVLAVGNDTDALEHMRNVILRALELGLFPMVLLSLTAGAALGHRALGRLSALDRAIADIRRGRISGRLPLHGSSDEFDRLALSINGMLDEIERLLDEVRGVGNSIAHDLRTPLTRARARLERSRDLVRTPDEYALAIDDALSWLDQTFAVINAVLRIGEIEHGHRRSAFGSVDLGCLVREAIELYEPVADEKGVALTVGDQTGNAHAIGDRDLIFEALTNLLDNALKFAPAQGHVALSLLGNRDTVTIVVADDGPGIAPEERDLVLRSFYRADASRGREGNGLGLPLVAAVAALHDGEITIGDNTPGCRIELTLPRWHDVSRAEVSDGLRSAANQQRARSLESRPMHDQAPQSANRDSRARSERTNEEVGR